jgi:hypothetical protein
VTLFSYFVYKNNIMFSMISTHPLWLLLLVLPYRLCEQINIFSYAKVLPQGNTNLSSFCFVNKMMLTSISNPIIFIVLIIRNCIINFFEDARILLFEWIRLTIVSTLYTMLLDISTTVCFFKTSMII